MALLKNDEVELGIHRTFLNDLLFPHLQLLIYDYCQVIVIQNPYKNDSDLAIYSSILHLI